MRVIPLSLREANAFVLRHHRHHPGARGCKFAIGLLKDEALVGVAVGGRPVSRRLDDGLTCEVTRLCTTGEANACSALYGACKRIAREMGFSSIITYTLAEESGVSLIAAGWTRERECRGGCWSSPPRPRRGTAPTTPKVRWGCRLHEPISKPSLPLALAEQAPAQRPLPGQLALFAEVS